MRKLSGGAIGVGLFAVVGVACSSADGNGGEGAVAAAGTTTTKSFDVSIQCGTPFGATGTVSYDIVKNVAN